MMTNDEKLAKLHEVSMLLLEKADSVMSQNSISYMLDAGTLLGAIRHKGFIPWDDDADICMMREEYDRFIKIAPKLFDGDFDFILPGQKGDNKFYDFVPKITYKKMCVAQAGLDDSFYGGKYSNPALDIFVIDKVPNSKIGQALHTKLLIFIYGMAMGHRREIDYSKYSKTEAAVIFVLSKIGKLIPLYVIASMYDAVAKMFSKKNKSKVMSTHSAMDHFGDCYEYDWYKDVLKKEFAGKMFPVPCGFDGILTKHYKDYMTLPPEEKRVPKHLQFDIFETRRD
ncbi:MAG: LicD family protein [Clostridia bacterium]|nr:LicD family protein [Clostridia bacterium]